MMTAGNTIPPAYRTVPPSQADAAGALGRVIEQVLGALGVGVVAFDADLRITAANEQAGHLLRIGDDLPTILHQAAFEPATQDWTRVLRDALAAGAPRQFDALCIRTAPDHARYYKLAIVPIASAEAGVRPSAPPLPQPRGEKPGSAAADVVGVVTLEEITQRIGIEQRLAVSERLAALGQLAARVAHELNNPLDGILRYVHLGQRVAEEVRHEKLSEYLSQAHSGLKRMVQIVRSLLEYARGGYAGPDTATLAALVEEAIGAFQRQAAGVGVSFVCSFEEEEQATAGATHLFQIFCNLIKNAIDAMPRGGVLTIRTRRGRDEWLISFEDTGVGLPPDADRIFEPFFTTKGPGAGAGLGLAVCRELIEKLGGRIGVIPRPEGGAAFTVHLPIMKAARPAFEERT